MTPPIFISEGDEISEIHSAHWAPSHARGRPPCIHIVSARVTFAHAARARVILRGIVRTGPTAVTTAETAVTLNQDNSVWTLDYCRRRAYLDTDGIPAVVACKGDIVGEHIRRPRAAAPRPSAACHFIHASPQDACRQIVFVFARCLACLTAGASGRVKIKTELSHGLESTVDGNRSSVNCSRIAQN